MHLPAFLTIEPSCQPLFRSNAQGHAIDRDAGFLVFLADAVDGFADDVYFYAVFALALTEVVNILFAASPFFVRDNVEYLHVDVVFSLYIYVFCLQKY